MLASTLHAAKPIMGECLGTGFIGRWNQLGCNDQDPWGSGVDVWPPVERKKTVIHQIIHKNAIIVSVSSHGHFGLHMENACEVLHIDAEGADCEILESMGDLSLIRRPRIIKLETRGLANTLFSPKKNTRPSAAPCRRFGSIGGLIM